MIEDTPGANGYAEGNLSGEALLERLTSPLRVKPGHGGTFIFLIHKIAEWCELRGGEFMNLPANGAAAA